MRRALLTLALLGLASGAWAQALGAPGIEYFKAFTGGTITAPILVPDGAVGTPSISFSSDPDTGFYWGSSGIFNIGINGVIKYTFSTSQFKFYAVQLQLCAAAGNNCNYITNEAIETTQFGVDAATASAQIVKGPDSTGANVAGAALTLKAGAGTSGNAAGGQLILQGGANAGSGEPGAVAIADGGTKPTCAAGIRGSIWYDAGGAGVADTFEVCAKQAAGDSYAWRVLATIP